MKKVLIITFYFAPFNVTGAYRALKFAKYLPENGWLPVVLTCSNPGSWLRDESLLDDVPAGVRVYKARRPDIRKLLQWPLSLWGFIRKKLWPRRRLENKTSSHEGTRLGLLSRIFHSIFIPDEMITWIPWAVFKALHICWKENISVVLTTSPPHSVHLIGYIISKLSGVRWVTDFRDPWVGNALSQRYFHKSAWRMRADTRLEKLIVARSDVVVANTEVNRNLMADRYRDDSPQKFQAIHNGFDLQDIKGINGGARSHQKLIFSFAGNLYEGMSEAFFATLEDIFTKRSDWLALIQIHLIGSQETFISEQLARQKQLRQILFFHGVLRKRQALEKLSQSDVLLYFSYPEESAAGWVPSKLYDFFMLNKPILGVGLRGEAAEIIRQAGVGAVVSPFEKEQIEEQMLVYIDKFKSGDLRVTPNREYLRRFERKKQAKRLAELLTLANAS